MQARKILRLIEFNTFDNIMLSEVEMNFYREKMREIRNSKGMSTRDLAGHLGISQAAVSYYESGKREPSFEQIANIATALGVAGSDLIQEDNQMSLSESYQLSLTQEVLKELAASLAAEVLDYCRIHKIDDVNNPMLILESNISYVENRKLLLAETEAELREIRGYLLGIQTYINEILNAKAAVA
jgi:transcriptional regulator with XRE-family HTH domain